MARASWRLADGLMRRWVKLSTLLFSVLASSSHAAPPILPYDTRSLGYSGWSDSVRGDIPHVGMAGAMVGLCPSFVSCLDNPAGLAMTLAHPGIQITGNVVYDGDLQEYGSALEASMVGATMSRYPWGLGLGWWEPHREGQKYRHPTTGETFHAEVMVREFHLSLGRVFLRNRLSVGLTLTLGYGRSTLNFADESAFDDTEATATGLSAGIGLQYRLPRRWILGWSYHLPSLLDPESSAPDDPGVARFHRALHVPFRLSFGAGYIPNRFFQLGFGFYYIGPVEDAAYLRDEVELGTKMNLQPRIGASYQFLDYRELDATIRLGTYLEISRSEVADSRAHFTTGFEVNPWVLTFGWGLDIAPRYRNYLVSAGIDVFDLFVKLDLLPREYHPPRAGFMPPIGRLSEDGLPRPLVEKWRERASTDILEESGKIPGRLGKKIKGVPGELKDFGGDILDVVGDGLEAVGDAVTGADEPEPSAQGKAPQAKTQPKKTPKPKKKKKKNPAPAATPGPS
ncbi:MAG: hypothetical protein IT285_04730 [Bdellovibrionales bacterium]|nr:hypothetical protein [Bdellovibrionales bacterium]